jgi:hypothetical protein
MWVGTWCKLPIGGQPSESARPRGVASRSRMISMRRYRRCPRCVQDLVSTLLLDAHVFLWWRTNDPRLASPARSAIATAPLVLVSAASAWEAAIKIAPGD